MLLEATERTDGITQVALVGRLDVTGLHEVDIKFHSATAARPHPAIVDLSGLAFNDSTGLRLLLQADARARERGYYLVLRPGAPPVQRVFEVTGALDVLRLDS